MNFKKYIFIYIIGWIGLSLNASAQPGEPITDLKAFCSQQKGFNLLGKFDVSWSNTGFPEKEFSIVHDLGCNFVRLPLDYRSYTTAGNWNIFTESEVLKIDKAIEWGELYDVHVCINLHRAPGYCINAADNLPANQQLNLWTDTVAQNAFVKHWAFFANRYKNISPERLSFNLVNEPSGVTEPVYVAIMQKAIKAIHYITPNRVVFVDGIEVGKGLLVSLAGEPNIAQSIHSYDPFSLTHYKASWVSGSSDWPVPQWPMLSISSFLYGTWKNEFRSSLVIQGKFEKGTQVTVNVQQVSIESTLSIKANKKTVYTKRFLCGADPGDDFTKVVQTEWGYQNISNKDFSCTLPDTASSISFENSAGDWMILNSISFKTGDVVRTYTLSDNTWGKKQDTYKIDENGALKSIDGSDLLPFKGYRDVVELANLHNIPVMVQEFGVHNQTPHKVAVDFLADLSAFFRQNNLGWALWNLSGSFGILNSDRADCTYENYQGYKLDRDMLDALTNSGTTNTTEIKKQSSFKVYPVPAKSNLNFAVESFSGKTNIKIINLTGQTLKSFNAETFDSNVQIDISGLNPGMYIISATNNGKIITGKFLVE